MRSVAVLALLAATAAAGTTTIYAPPCDEAATATAAAPLGTGTGTGSGAGSGAGSGSGSPNSNATLAGSPQPTQSVHTAGGAHLTASAGLVGVFAVAAFFL